MTTIPEMKERCLEAAETFRRLERVGGRVGPSVKSGFWPEIVREQNKGDRADEVTRVRLIPTALDIQRAEEFAGWVNTYLDEQQRADLHQWVALKTSRNATIRGYCKKIGLREHNYRRKIDALFERLAFTVYGKQAVTCSTGVDEEQNPRDKRAGSENYWRDDESFRRRSMIQSLLDKSEKRIGSQTRAA